MPAVPTLTVTRLGTVWPATKFRFEMTGGPPPVGKTVRKLGAVALVTVTLSTTAATPTGGTLPTPVIVTSSWAPAATGPVGAPMALRVSSTRAGTTGV